MLTVNGCSYRTFFRKPPHLSIMVIPNRKILTLFVNVLKLKAAVDHYYNSSRSCLGRTLKLNYENALLT